MFETLRKFAATATSCMIALAAMTADAGATPALWTGSGTAAGVGVSASALFTISGNTLTIVLQNTSASHAAAVQDVPGSTLTGLFFDLTGSPTLTPVSSLIAAGSIVQGGACTGTCGASTTNVGGEFGYQATSFPNGADRGIASSGYLTTGLSGNIGNFNNGAAGTDLDNPASLDGINFGIISAAAGFNPNGGLSGDPLIRDAVTFTLTGALGLTEDDISHVSFQYGTSLTETNIVGFDPPPPPGIGAPEPASLTLFGLGMAGLAIVRRRRAG